VALSAIASRPETVTTATYQIETRLSPDDVLKRADAFFGLRIFPIT
jgi:hypothetical protein